MSSISIQANADKCASSHNQKGMTDEAIAELKMIADRAGGFTLFKSVLGYVLAKAGKIEEANAILNELKLLAPEHPVPAYEIALSYTGLNDKDHVFAWLNKSFAEHDPFLVYLKTDPKF